MQRARKVAPPVERRPESRFSEALEHSRALRNALPGLEFLRVRELRLPVMVQHVTRQTLEQHADNVDELKEHFDAIIDFSKWAHEVASDYSQGKVTDIRAGAVVGNLKDTRDHLLTGVEAFIQSQRSKRKSAILTAKGIGQSRRLEKARLKIARILAHRQASDIGALEPTFRMMLRRVRKVRESFERTS